MSGPWDRAVADAAEAGIDDNVTAIGYELECLWSDLDTAIDMTLRTPGNPDGKIWSMGANNVAARIITLSRVAGATPWQKIPITRLLDGTYAGLLDAAGITRDGPSDDDLRQLREDQERRDVRQRRM